MLGLHVLVDQLSATDLASLSARLADHAPLPTITVMGGSRFNQAAAWAGDLVRDYPDTRVILRRWPDDGLYLNMTPQAWLDSMLRYGQQGLTLMPDNESMAPDLRHYAGWMAEAIYRAGEQGIGVAAGRFAVGNPGEHQYLSLAPMWQALNDYQHLSCWSPNEYLDLTPAGSSGAIGRYKLGWAACLKLDLQPPPVVIGEYGLAAGLDAHAGWLKSGWSWERYLDELWAYHETYYWPWGISPQVFSVGQWHGFELTLNQVSQLLERNDKVAGRVTETILAKAGGWVSGKLEGQAVQLRQQPRRTVASHGVLQPGTDVQYLPWVQVGRWQFLRTMDGKTGWVHLTYARAVASKPTPPGTLVSSANGSHRVVVHLSDDGVLMVYPS